MAWSPEVGCQMPSFWWTVQLLLEFDVLLYSQKFFGLFVSEAFKLAFQLLFVSVLNTNPQHSFYTCFIGTCEAYHLKTVNPKNSDRVNCSLNFK